MNITGEYAQTPPEIDLRRQIGDTIFRQQPGALPEVMRGESLLTGAVIESSSTSGRTIELQKADGRTVTTLSVMVERGDFAQSVPTIKASIKDQIVGQPAKIRSEYPPKPGGPELRLEAILTALHTHILPPDPKETGRIGRHGLLGSIMVGRLGELARSFAATPANEIGPSSVVVTKLGGGTTITHTSKRPEQVRTLAVRVLRDPDTGKPIHLDASLDTEYSSKDHPRIWDKKSYDSARPWSENTLRWGRLWLAMRSALSAQRSERVRI